jgi:hypothetical protein
MFCRTLDEPIEHVIKDLVTSAGYHGRMKLINAIHKRSVMTIKITDPDAKGRTPMNEFWNFCRTAHAPTSFDLPRPLETEAYTQPP